MSRIEGFSLGRTLLYSGADDRAVGPDHEWSNYKLAYETLLSKVAVPEQNVFRIKGELGASEAASDMHRNLENTFDDEGDSPFRSGATRHGG